MKKAKHGYFITAICPALDKNGNAVYSYKKVVTYERRYRKNIPEHRCWGWFSDYKRAENEIKKDAEFISEENFYPFAVIEKVPEGTCVTDTEEMGWYMYVPENKIFVDCPKPEFSNNMINWSIG